MINLPKSVDILESGPRDGIQNETTFIPTAKKLELINALSETGLKRIEATSFVSPKHVPQMADATEVYQNMMKKNDIQYLALIPNLRGFELAKKAGVREIALVAGASETFNKNNVRMSVEESLRQLSIVNETAKEEGMFVRFSIATSFFCPYEGLVSQETVLAMVKELEEMKVNEIVLCDTIGRANPKQVYELFSRVLDQGPTAKITAHLHDTYGLSKANSLAALHAGVSSFDTAIGGLGGCPFAPGAAGNDSTEDFVFMLHEMGIQTGVHFEKLMDCVKLVKSMTKRSLTGHLQQITNKGHVQTVS
ncbi:hydroxymethylglutaryl-CoA lyase [Fictibacillus solisalsi]|uniref:Hydroxymethylglutaryl-CoA lyase n=1 Tax=Fictibacillus solisalsi TaxID=459525 RepID=A0A1G9Y7D6_9BACL|nr:hydroxymethylglutaryl-CoA lyase [Fictibacillus solisalsi]SDN04999.1 hydroxymethylglutaryl-CoA lyase [Fictibacillus solisalsi]